VTTTNTSDITINSPQNGVWYNPGSIYLDIPIGAWDVSFSVDVQDAYTSVKNFSFYAALSTSASSASDNQLMFFAGASNAYGLALTFQKEKFLKLGSKTRYYLITKQSCDATGYWIVFAGSNSPTTIRAVCAYL